MLFPGFGGRTLGKEPSALRLVHIQPDLNLSVLDQLECQRHNAVRSRKSPGTQRCSGFGACRAAGRLTSRRALHSLQLTMERVGTGCQSGLRGHFETPLNRNER
jgi:hypothetical protein